MTITICKKNIPVQNRAKTDIVEYYNVTSPDYEGWSKDYNMHFGYFRFKNWRQFFKEIWHLEPHLKQANIEVFEKLNVVDNGHYLDMGCGLGGTARSFAKKYSKAKLTGISITPSQIREAKHLLQKEHPDARNIDFQQMDYQHTSFKSESFDAVYAMESACYAKGDSREEFVAEAHRLLKPHGKIVIHDAFTLCDPKKCNFLYRYAYHWLCKGWAVENYIHKDTFEATLKKQGFKNIQFTNAFWNVLPSALHIPRVVITYAIKKMLFSKSFYCNAKVRKQRLNHLLSSVAAIFVPMHSKRFGYFVVTATK